jgi:hypothetical protein
VYDGLNFSFFQIKTACAQFPSFSVSPTSRNQFNITHYAGKVAYTITGFVERNRDTLPEDMRQLMATSRNPLLARLFGDSEGERMDYVVLFHLMLRLAGIFGNRSVEADGMSEDLLSKDASIVRSFLLLDVSSASNESKDSNSSASKKTAGRQGRVDEGSLDMSKTKRRSSFMLAGTVTSKFKTQLAGKRI